MNKILIVEDDKDIAQLERDYLEINNFVVNIINDGAEALEQLENYSYDLIILDIMLPNINGYELCKEIRKVTDIPIIMVSARGDTIDQVRGLGLGSDDYIVKPFDPSILVAKVKSHLNTYQRLKGKNNELLIGNIKIIPDNYQVFKDDFEIKLANKEFELLNYMANHANIVISKSNLFEAVWGMNSDTDDSTVMVHINRIREKIEDDSANPKIIETIWGVGYRLNK